MEHQVGIMGGTVVSTVRFTLTPTPIIGTRHPGPHRQKVERVKEVNVRWPASRTLGEGRRVIPTSQGNVQKSRSPPWSRFGGARSSKAAGPWAGGAYTVVGEHDNGPRTPLAGFFNIPPSFLGS